ncbi:hypothetical protein F2Q69_00034879 [Brassica cretica]|uniref:Uncharacterized protein n=1 Tax=Brassica cretica TaxID=69181 RepID=A0A8S9SSS7_BRACR|nr:hypothetical protein F2Q69_00034879 [Brassica cretica]
MPAPLAKLTFEFMETSEALRCQERGRESPRHRGNTPYQSTDSTPLEIKRADPQTYHHDNNRGPKLRLHAPPTRQGAKNENAPLKP